MNKNPDHSQEVQRINRIKGQLDGIKKMIEEGRYCPEILQQSKAIRSAIRSLERKILEKHLSGCVQKAFASGNKKEQEEKKQELLDIFKKY